MKTTWGRTIERERGKVGQKSWNVARAAARDGGGSLVDNVTALSASWRNER